MAINGAIRLDKVQATRTGAISSVKSAVDLQNGVVVFAHALAAGERDALAAVQPATATITTDEVLLVASPEITYNAGETVVDFINKAGSIARAIHLKVGDVVTITDNVITGSTVVGQYLIPQNASYNLALAATLAGGTRFAAEIIEKGTIYGQASTTVRVVKA